MQKALKTNNFHLPSGKFEIFMQCFRGEIEKRFLPTTERLFCEVK